MVIDFEGLFGSEDKKCFVIAEAGVNHNGSVEIAKKLIDAAKDAGADAVKFQTFITEDLVNKSSPAAKYQVKNSGYDIRQMELLKKLELSSQAFEELKAYCDSKKIVFMSTPHTESSLNMLKGLIDIYKIGSGDLNNTHFVEEIARLKKPIILSTGMGTYDEIGIAIQTIRRHHNNIVVLHCTTNYPCPLDQVNLLAMLEIERRFGVKAGYSDHTQGIEVSVMATSLGASVIEKHLTLDRDMKGPDHKASLEPEEMKKMITMIRAEEVIDIPKTVLGSRNKVLSAEEIENKTIVRKSIIARIPIRKGQLLTKDMLVVKRPGTGIAPTLISQVVGRRVKKNIGEDDLIRWDDLE